MTIFLLIRHGSNDMIDRNVIAGRSPGVHLNATGRREAADLAEYLSAVPLDGVYSSPLERTLETAQPIALRQDREVEILPEINEVDLGQWTGRSFDDLNGDPQWQAYNASRSGTRIPEGEIALEVQLRMVVALEGLRERHRKSCIALVSHGDPIRTAVAHCLNMPLDAILRFRIDPASVSVVEFGYWHAPRVRCVNSDGRGLPV